MSRRTLVASTFAVLLAATGTSALAQTSAPAAPPVTGAAQPAAWHGHDGHHAMHEHRFGKEKNPVIGDLHELQFLYMMSGRSKDMASVYQDVLAKSQDPRVRDYAYRHLARLQAQPTNVSEAIATLRKGLDENLANEAKMHAEREKMRAAWQSRHTQPDAGAASTTTPAVK